MSRASPAVFAPTINSMGNQTGIAAAQGAIATMNSFLGLIFDYSGPTNQQEAATAIGFAPEIGFGLHGYTSDADGGLTLLPNIGSRPRIPQFPRVCTG